VAVDTFSANTQQQITLPENGTYIIRVRANTLVNTGSYNLGVECLQPLDSPIEAVLSCGDLASGSIDASGEVDLYTLTGQAGDMILLTLTETGGFPGGSAPQLTLFSPSLEVVDTFNANTQQQITLPENGTYIIRVRANTLVNTGSYNLGVECLQPV
jgi:hypothetical protein